VNRGGVLELTSVLLYLLAYALCPSTLVRLLRSPAHKFANTNDAPSTSALYGHFAQPQYRACCFPSTTSGTTKNGAQPTRSNRPKLANLSEEKKETTLTLSTLSTGRQDLLAVWIGHVASSGHPEHITFISPFKIAGLSLIQSNP
jgi:hypothetical protein